MKLTVSFRISELEFIVLACDGIFDVMSNSEVVNFVRARIAEKMDPPTVVHSPGKQCELFARN